jgi:hypothetical protein
MARLQSVGLRRIFLGLESFDHNQLRDYRKNISVWQNLKALLILSRLNIAVTASVILANACTTFWQLIRQFIMLRELQRRYFCRPGYEISINNRLEIYRGSALYREYREQGRLIRDHYRKGIHYRLKFFTCLRLQLFVLENKLYFKMVNLGKFIKKLWSQLKWRKKTSLSRPATGLLKLLRE